MDCHSSKLRVLGLIALGCVMVACAFVCTRRDGVVAQIAGWSGLVFFGACLVGWTVRLFARGPRVRIDTEGIEERGIGVVRWNEIRAVWAADRFLCVDPIDPATFLARLPWWRRWIAKLQVAVGWPPLTIFFIDLIPNLREVRAHLEREGRITRAAPPDWLQD